MPNTGPKANMSFQIQAGEKIINISQDVYGNDFSGLVASINSQTVTTGLTASFNGNNQLVLSGNFNELKISDFKYTGEAVADPSIQVINPSDGSIKENIAQKELQSETIRTKLPMLLSILQQKELRLVLLHEEHRMQKYLLKISFLYWRRIFLK